MMQHQQPSIIFKNKKVRSVSLCAAHLLAGGGCNAFEAGDPSGRTLDFDRYFRHIDSHECGVVEDLFPTRADVFPPGKPLPVGMDTDGAGVGRPDFVHQFDIEAFEREVELEVRLNDLFGISHKESSFITSLDSDATGNIHDDAFRFGVAVRDRKSAAGRGIATFVELRRGVCRDTETARESHNFVGTPNGVLAFDDVRGFGVHTNAAVSIPADRLDARPLHFAGNLPGDNIELVILASSYQRRSCEDHNGRNNGDAGTGFK